MDDEAPVYLVDMEDQDSWLLFQLLSMHGEWLTSYPKEWNESGDFMKLFEVVTSIQSDKQHGRTSD